MGEGREREMAGSSSSSARVLISRVLLLAVHLFSFRLGASDASVAERKYTELDSIAMCGNTSIAIRFKTAPDPPFGGHILYARDEHNQLAVALINSSVALVSVRVSIGLTGSELVATVAMNDSDSANEWRTISITVGDRIVIGSRPLRHVTVYRERNDKWPANATVSFTNLLLGRASWPDRRPADASFLREFRGRISYLSVSDGDDTCANASRRFEPVQRSLWRVNERPSEARGAATQNKQNATWHAARARRPAAVRDSGHGPVQATRTRNATRSKHERLSRAVWLSGSSSVRLQLVLGAQESRDQHEQRQVIDIDIGIGIDSLFETVELRFRTVERHGVLFHVGDDKQYVVLTLNDGRLWLLANLSGHVINETLFASQGAVAGVLNDARWHYVKFERSLAAVSVVVNGAVVLHKDAAHPCVLTLTQVSFGSLLVRSAGQLANLYEPTMLTAFRGLVRDVLFTSSSLIPIPVVELLYKKHPLVTIVSLLGAPNELTSSEPSRTHGVSFQRHHSGIVLHDVWSSVSRDARTATVSFHSAERDGTLFFHLDYLHSNSTPETAQVVRQMSLQLVNASLYFSVVFHNASTRVRLLPAYRTHVHVISVVASSRLLRVYADDRVQTIQCQPTPSYTQLHSVTVIGDSYQLGKLDQMTVSKFQGCVDRLYIDGAMLDLQLYSNRSIDTCASLPLANPRRTDTGSFKLPSAISFRSAVECRNGGRSVELGDRFACDCTATDFDGDMCQSLTPTLTLHTRGSFLKIDLPSLQQSESNQVTIRFRATVSNGTFGGVLLMTSSPDSNDHLCVFIDKNGLLRVSMDLGSTKLNLSDSALSVTANEWHSVQISRTLLDGNHRVEIVYDDSVLDANLVGNSTSLEFKSVIFGSHEYSRAWSLPVTIPAGLAELHALPSFVGQMQHLMLNEQPYLKAIYDKRVAERRFAYELNADVSTANKALLYPVTLSAQNYTLRRSVAFETLFIDYETEFETNLRFLFKTSLANAVFVQAECVPTKQIVAESIIIKVRLDAGKVNLRFDVDERMETSEQTVTSNRGVVNDDKWHSVQVRLASRVASIVVDEHPPANLYMTAEQHDRLFAHATQYECAILLGGATTDLLGYQGCIASFEINGQLIDVSTGERLPKHDSSKLAITSSRSLPSDYCAAQAFDSCSAMQCYNRGLPIAQMDTCKCDCSMTSFGGTACSKYSTSYKFESSEDSKVVPSDAYIVFDYPPDERRDRRVDMISFGVRTRLRDCFVLSLESARKQRDGSSDYLEIILRTGIVTVRYNVGDGERRIIGRDNVADGRYHAIRLMRNGANGVLQVDGNPPIESANSSTSKHIIFNAQSRIVVAKATLRQRKTRNHADFAGLLYGLHVNNMFIFDGLAALQFGGANISIGSGVSRVQMESDTYSAEEDGQADAPNNAQVARSSPVSHTDFTSSTDLSAALQPDDLSAESCSDSALTGDKCKTSTPLDSVSDNTTNSFDSTVDIDYEDNDDRDADTSVVKTGDVSTSGFPDSVTATRERSKVNEETMLRDKTKARQPGFMRPSDPSQSLVDYDSSETSTPRQMTFTSGIQLLPIIGVAVGCFLVSVIVSIVAYKCFKKMDTGSYSVEGSAAERIALQPTASNNSSAQHVKSKSAKAQSPAASQLNGILKNGRHHHATTTYLKANNHTDTVLETANNREWFV